jgi:hypothetical protein
MLSKSYFLAALLPFCITSVSGQVTDLGEKKPEVVNGVEYGYIIKNEQTKTAKGEEYGRFEITLYATNNSGCTKLYADRTTFLSTDSPSLLATFNCSNANGKRLTAKSGTVKARDFYVNARYSENGRELTRAVKAGYIFRNGETLKTNIIVLVPLGERPVFTCSLNSLPELQ